MTQNTFLFSNSIQKWMSVRGIKARHTVLHDLSWFLPNTVSSLQLSAGGKRSHIDLLLQHSRIWGMQCQESLFSFVLALLKASGSLLRKRKNIFSYSLWWCCCLRDSSQGANMENKHEHYLCTLKVLVPLACEGAVSGAADTHEQRLFCRTQMGKLKHWCQEWTWIFMGQLEDFLQSLFYVWEWTLMFAELISAGGCAHGSDQSWETDDFGWWTREGSSQNAGIWAGCSGARVSRKVEELKKSCLFLPCELSHP